MLEAMAAPSIDSSVVLKTEFTAFSTTDWSTDGAIIASELTSDSFVTNYEKKLSKRNHLCTVASSILETLSLRFMCCISIYLYKESFNFVYVSSSASSECIISTKL